MAKRKIRQILKNEPEEFVLDSGVTVRVRPFPAGLYEKVQQRALKDFPDPPLPQKTIEVVDGTEVVDDPDDPDYKKEVTAVERQRSEFLGEAAYDLCVEVVDIDQWEPTIKRLEKWQDPFPEDPDDRRIEFLTSFAMATAGDYKKVMTSAISQTLIEDPEVAARLQSFQSQVERATGPDVDAPGPDGNERVAVQPTFPGT